MSLKVLRTGHCNDCLRPHGRGPVAALCFSCRDKREGIRNKSEKYLEYQRRYNRSPKGKLMKGRWYDAHRELTKIRSRVSYLRLRGQLPAKIQICETLGCTNTFIRVKSSRARFCRECVLVFFGPAYARRRKAA